MTNGEKIKEIFPSIELYEKSHDAIQINFDSAWWNAEYTEPTRKTCKTCRNFGSHVGKCDICHKFSLWTEKEQSSSEIPTSSDLSSGTRKNSKKLENANPIIDWNNCHTSEQLDSILTTKNDLGVDAVSRDEVCRYVAEFVNHEFSTKEEEELIDNIITGIERIPSITPIRPKGHWIK